MPKVAEDIFKVLHKYGVQQAFGIPGDYALSLFDRGRLCGEVSGSCLER